LMCVAYEAPKKKDAPIKYKPNGVI
jgi:hypothetical protein